MSTQDPHTQCQGSGRGAIFDFRDPAQTTCEVQGRDFITGQSVITEVPSNGQCIRCKQWIPITDRGTLSDHKR